jgi:hypothetical protein
LVQVPTTIFDQSAMVALLDALNHLRQICGQDKIGASTDRLHIVQDQSYDQAIGSSYGFEMGGRVYLPNRSRDRSDHFAHALSHELAHLSSFFRLRVTLTGQGKQATIVEVKALRSGLRLLGDAGGTEFCGLNEAVTEYVALLARHEVASGVGPFAQHCAATRYKLIGHLNTCAAIIALLKKLVASQVRPAWIHATEIWRRLMIDYWSGSDEFLETVRQADAVLFDDLRQLGTDQTAALDFAKKHGLALTNRG